MSGGCGHGLGTARRPQRIKADALPGAGPGRASRTVRDGRRWAALLADAEHLARRLAEPVLGRAGPDLDDVALARAQLLAQLGRADVDLDLRAALDGLEGREQRLVGGGQ